MVVVVESSFGVFLFDTHERNELTGFFYEKPPVVVDDELFELLLVECF